MTLQALSVDYDMKPCPFCAGTRVRLHSYQQHGEQFQVLCLAAGCGAKGPRRYDGDEALQAWNSRELPRIKRPPNLPLFHKRFEHDACLVCGEYHGNTGLPCPTMTPMSRGEDAGK